MKLALFFTYGTSLENWTQTGSFDRELDIYRRLAEHFETIFFLTYGEDDARYAARFPKNIVILPKKMPIANSLYSLILPFRYRAELRSCAWFKTNQMLGSWSAVLAKFLFRKKLLFRTGYTESISFVGKGFWKKKIIEALEFVAYRSADTSIVTSAHQSEYVAKKYHVKNVSVLPNGINTDLFQPKLRSSSQDIRLLYVGRLHPEKNLLSLLRGCAGIPDLQLTLVGKGPLKDELLSLAQELHMNFQLRDSVPNAQLPSVYNEADIYIQPSLYEGNPKTILEAMSCGLPVIGTNVSGIRELLHPGDTGFLCEKDEASLHTAILTLAQNPSLRSQLGKNARTYILDHFNMNKLIKKEVALYV